ncbi:MAG TPA: MerR family DNA-binding transcriptional regulator [Kiloniellales bacterium]
MSRSYSIAELAREFAVTTRAIRFYEDQWMLSPLRDGQRRIYRPRDRTRLKLILRGKRLGFPLAEVREIIDLYDAPLGEDAQLHRFLAKIAERRHELEAKREDIEASIGELDAAADTCRARLKELESVRGSGRRAKKPRRAGR